MMEEEYRIKGSCFVIAHIAIGAVNRVGIKHPLLVEPPNGKMDLIMRIFQCDNVVTRFRVPSAFSNPLVLGGGVRKDCVVGRSETSQEFCINGVGVWPWCILRVVRDLDGPQQPLRYIFVEGRRVLSWIWVLRIMCLCCIYCCVRSLQA